ncbi:transposase [Burkholderia cepacia]|uniref:transposase n=1 Tax=Burkholderia TaxID=32008 RepID=UPI0009E5FA18
MKVVIVQKTFEPGASASDVAGCHSLNLNQVFAWVSRNMGATPAIAGLSASGSAFRLLQKNARARRGYTLPVLSTRSNR